MIFEPLKLVITTFVLSARCKRHKVKLRQAAALIHSTAILNARAVPRQNSAVPFSGGGDEVRAGDDAGDDGGDDGRGPG